MVSVTRSGKKFRSSLSGNVVPVHSSIMSDTKPSVGDLGVSVPGSFGPGNWVDPVTYRQLRKRFRAEGRKSVSKKRPTRRRTTVRRTVGGRRYGSRYDGHLGPIVITGRGNYFTDRLRGAASAGYRALQRGVPRGMFSRLGGAVGGSLGGGTGAGIGKWLGSQVANVAGFGDYTISSNSLLRLDEGMQVPSFGDMNHAIVISHREYVRDIEIPATPGAFTLQSFPINPGLPSSFPWLSSIAPSFDQYEIQGMLFEFKSTSSDFGTTTSLAMGTVILATDYDSADSNYSSKIEMENAQYSTSCKPSVSCIHAIECDPSLNFSPIKYVRTGGVPSGKDIRLYDQGNFQIATVGLPTGSSGVIGELWVTYQIKFFKPALTLGNNQLSATCSAASWGATTRFGLVSFSFDPENSLQVVLAAQNTLGFSNLPVGGTLLVTYSTTQAAFLFTQPFTFPVTTGFTIKESRPNSAGTTTAVDGFYLVLRITASSALLNVENRDIPAGQSNVRTIITLLDKDMADSAWP